MENNTQNTNLSRNDDNTMLGEVISAEKIITNILNMYNLNAVE